VEYVQQRQGFAGEAGPSFLWPFADWVAFLRQHPVSHRGLDRRGPLTGQRQDSLDQQVQVCDASYIRPDLADPQELGRDGRAGSLEAGDLLVSPSTRPRVWPLIFSTSGAQRGRQVGFALKVPARADLQEPFPAVREVLDAGQR